ncbi:MAG: hypothetical protein WBG62_15335, partial [Cyclobacteriaceae bacterium]
SIYYESNFGGNKFYQQYSDGYEPLGNRQLKAIMQDNQEAYRMAKKASGNDTFSSIFAFAGGIMAGIPLGTLAVGGDANWTMAAIGGGLIVASIPFAVGSNRKMRRAVDIYNSSVEGSIRQHPSEFKFVFNGQGAGLSFSF